ncbi:TetR/AcrR family transcriptional regulator [Acetobacterium paludosum]|uniref:TetR/AcrR family transcriptional regulator n=1 Tax=Acetobacterium paludosum TaxID=52693 RepID=A0A923HYU9_9FIRM|nr:TetR/AcrR family transcriptional regulator [Acetobacterium paludosum]MBC3887083.1 TetR/AcrR family transcriptional regulator [Acetobacterium paludosum]
MRNQEVKKNDRRTRYTRKAIKEAFLNELSKKKFGKISVTMICQICEINRGTFYLHYYDLDDVLDDVLSDALADTSDVLDHVLCPDKMNCTYPFCEKMQSNQKYRPLFFDEIAASRLIGKLSDLAKEDFVTRLMQNSILTYEQAEAIFYFQINGCLTINQMMFKNHCTDWKKIQLTIDGFLRAGIQAFLDPDRA